MRAQLPTLMSQVGYNLRLSQLHPLRPSHTDQSDLMSQTGYNLRLSQLHPMRPRYNGQSQLRSLGVPPLRPNCCMLDTDLLLVEWAMAKITQCKK